MIGLLLTVIIVLAVASVFTYVLLPLIPGLPPQINKAITVIVWLIVAIWLLIVLVSFLGYPIGISRLGCS